MLLLYIKMPINPFYSGIKQEIDIDEVEDLEDTIENLQINIDNEITNRTNADNALQTAINEKLDEANSNYKENRSFYCVDGKNDLHSVLPNITNQASTISVSSGSFGNTQPLIIDKNNLAIYSVPSSPPICEFNALLTIPSTASLIRFNYLSFDNTCVINGRDCVFSNSTFNNDCFIGEGMNTYQTYNNCEFSSGKTITFSNQLAGAIYFINCNISSANLVFNNLSPLLVIFSNCSGFISLPTSSQATLFGLNVKADGSIIQQNISKIVLPSGQGLNNQVLTSTGSGNAIWTTPSGGGVIAQIKFEQTSNAVEALTNVNAGQAGGILEDLSIIITPTEANSVIKIEAQINGEFTPTDVEANCMFFISRNINGVITKLSAPPSGTRTLGLTVPTLSRAGDAGSTMEVANVCYFDSPATTEPILYQIGVLCGFQSFSYFLNRTAYNGDGNQIERSVSYISATEITQ